MSKLIPHLGCTTDWYFRFPSKQDIKAAPNPPYLKKRGQTFTESPHWVWNKNVKKVKKGEIPPLEIGEIFNEDHEGYKYLQVSERQSVKELLEEERD